MVTKHNSSTTASPFSDAVHEMLQQAMTGSLVTSKDFARFAVSDEAHTSAPTFKGVEVLKAPTGFAKA